MRRVYCIVGLVFGVFLTGCVDHLSVSQCPDLSPSVRAERLAELGDVWSIRGSIAFIGKDPKASFSGSYRLQHRENRDQLDVYGPLGLGGVRIIQNSDGATLQQGSKPVIRAKNAERLMVQHFGWHLPMTKLIHWMKGGQAPQIKANWGKIEFKSYQCVQGLKMPKKTHLQTRSGLVKLSVQAWTFS